MVRAAALILCLALAGCEQSIDDQFAGANARQAIWTNNAQDHRLAEAEDKIAALELRIAALERDNDALADQVSHNARAANANAAREMTRNAACGTRLVRHPSGVVENQIIPCTEADLEP